MRLTLVSLRLASTAITTALLATRVDAATLVGLPDTVTISEETTSSIHFDLKHGASAFNQLALTASSSDQPVIPNTAILFAGAATHQAMILSPTRPGRTQITIAVSDGQGFATRSVAVTVTPRASSSPEMLLSAVVSEKPIPAIRLIFPVDPKVTNYVVSRKRLDANSWDSPIATLPGSATEFLDTNVAIGSAYEYRVVKNLSYPAFIYAGVRTRATQDRGVAILMVDQTHARDLTPELSRLDRDLAGDGWRVIRHDVSPTDDPRKIKTMIQKAYRADPAHVRSLFLFGHVPIAHSGWYSPDGHHERAFPADVFYADLDGVWTDESNGVVQPGRSETRNYAGDGRYDQSSIPSDVELAVGRVDLFNMPAFLPRTEKDLLRQYLNKDHNYRHGLFSVERRGLADGWVIGSLPNQATMFGPSSVFQRPFLPSLKSEGYLWASRAQYGHYQGFNDAGGTTADFAASDPQAVFLELAGSYFGEWDIYDDFLRAALCTPTYTLAASYSMPKWRYHHMALGETAGFTAKSTQNNRYKTGLYLLQDGNEGKVHIALMGDPTLRLHPVLPVSQLVPAVHGNRVRLNWIESPDVVEGYHVYRSSATNGPFVRRTGALLKDAAFEESAPAGTYTYMVRVLKVEVSASGTYENLSQGIMRTVRVDEAGDTLNPNVTITSPTPNAILYTHAPLLASATDNRGIAKVDFFDDDIYLGTSVEPPYFLEWDTARIPAGIHSITVKAFDLAGNSSQDTVRCTLSKSDRVPPSISITQPALGSRVWGNVIVRCIATDNDAIQRVELRVDDQLIATSKTAPYDFPWKTFDYTSGKQTTSDGPHSVQARAYDLAGNHSDQTITITVDHSLSHPTILTASPQNLVAQAGQVVDLTYRWQGGPALRDYAVFTHFVNASGNSFGGDSHMPPIPTHYWSEPYSYPVKFRINRSLNPGSYKVIGGLYMGPERLNLNVGSGVIADEQQRYQIATLTIMPDTTPPTISSGSLHSGQKLASRVTLSVGATDNVALDHAELLVDGHKESRINLTPNLTGRDLETKDNLFYTGSYAWETARFSNGAHQVTLRAVDSSGNRADLTTEVELSNPMLFMASPQNVKATAGDLINLTYHWRGGPTPYSAQIATELINESTKRMLLRTNHTANPPPEKWTGNDFTYAEPLLLPPTLPPAKYTIAVRMLISTPGYLGTAPIVPGPGIIQSGTNFAARYFVGSLTVTPR